jgi:integrase
MSIRAKKRNGKPTGSWDVEVGPRHNRLRGVAKTWEEAQALQASLLARLEAGVTGGREAPKLPAKPQTLAEAVNLTAGKLWGEGEWSSQAKAHVLSLASLIGEERHMSTLTEDDFEKAAEELLEERAPATVNRYLSSVSKLLAHAHKKGWIEEELDLPWQKESEGRIRFLTAAEEVRLFEHLPQDMRAFCTLAIETGMRRGELLRIKREDVVGFDWLMIPQTKNGSPRGVPLTQRAFDALNDLWTLGFPTKQRVRQQFERAREIAGLHDVVFHSLRHTCCTRLMQAGVDIQKCKEWMGHRSINTTMRYRHVTDTMLKDVAHQLELKRNVK